MWLLFHHNAKTRLVDGGHSFRERCPECERQARFDEVEVIKSYGVFFVDLLDDKERKYRCSACHEIFDLRADAPAQAEPATSDEELAAERAAQHAAAEARRAAAGARHAVQAEQRREQAQAKAIRIEDELAELKKRLGR